MFRYKKNGVSPLKHFLVYLLVLKSSSTRAGCRNEYLTSNSLLLTPVKALPGEVVSFDDDDSGRGIYINRNTVKHKSQAHFILSQIRFS